MEITEKSTKGIISELLQPYQHREWRGQVVAIKRLLCQKVDQVDMSEIKLQLKEIALMSELRHPNVSHPFEVGLM